MNDKSVARLNFRRAYADLIIKLGLFEARQFAAQTQRQVENDIN